MIIHIRTYAVYLYFALIDDGFIDDDTCITCIYSPLPKDLISASDHSNRWNLIWFWFQWPQRSSQRCLHKHQDLLGLTELQVVGTVGRIGTWCNLLLVNCTPPGFRRRVSHSHGFQWPWLGQRKERLEKNPNVEVWIFRNKSDSMLDSISLYLLYCSIIAWKYLHVSNCDTIPSNQETQSASDTCRKNSGSGCRFDGETRGCIHIHTEIQIRGCIYMHRLIYRCKYLHLYS